MTWIFSALLVAAILHVVEEYVYPGGFANGLKRLNPGSAHLITPLFTITVNGGFLLLCAIAAVVGERVPILGLSVAGLIFINAVLHIRGVLLTGEYYPGVVSAILLYIPLSVVAFAIYISSGQVTFREALLSGILGALYMAVPMVIILAGGRRR